MTRALVAARLSRITESGASRIERDDDAAQKWARANGRKVVAISEDRGVSGGTDPFKRPSLGPWLSDPVRMAQYDEIVASSLDRLGRDARDVDRLKVWAEDNDKRITILSPLLHWPPSRDDIASPIIWHVLADIAQMERSLITKRYADARAHITDNGGLIGKAPFGFQVVGDKYSKTLVPDRELVPYIREMIGRSLKGDTYRSIAQYLDAAGVVPVQHREGKTPKVRKDGTAERRWSQSSVVSVLRSPALKGRRIDLDGRVTLKHEAIISASEWAKLQAALDSRPKRRGPVTPETSALTGVIVCALCGGSMYRHRSISRRSGGVKEFLYYYRCRGTDQAPSQCRNMVPLEEIEQWVDLWFTVDGPFCEVEIKEVVIEPGADHAAEIQELEAEIRELDLDDPAYDAKLAALRAERKRLQLLPVEPARVTERPTGELVKNVWAALSYEGKRRFLTSTGLHVYVRPVGKQAKRRVASADEVSNFGKGRHIVWMADADPSRVAASLQSLHAAS